MRILYDSSRYLLLSHCAESTAGHAYSSSCSFKLPLLGSDKETDRRRAAYAEFKDRKTGAKFFMVSVHLDARHSSKAATERNLNTLRGNQALTVASTMAKIAGTVPVIVGGDFNSWQNNKIGNNPHDKLIGQGYYDTSAATTRINFQYSTMNDFKTKMSAASQGFGVRLDMLLVKGVRGSSRFENVMKVTDRSRASDHNMVLSDIVL
jgi:endonuclease/exonuclease/phosphatase family metal-dependent hydrolase